MTNPEYQGIPTHDSRQAVLSGLRQEVLSWYEDESPEFAHEMHDGKIGMLRLDELLTICGEEISKIPTKNLKPMFDKRYDIAKMIHERGDQFVDMTRKVGGEVLARYEQGADE